MAVKVFKPRKRWKASKPPNRCRACGGCGKAALGSIYEDECQMCGGTGLHSDFVARTLAGDDFEEELPF